MNVTTTFVSDLIEQIKDHADLLHEVCTDHVDELYTSDEEKDFADALVDIIIAFEEGMDNE